MAYYNQNKYAHVPYPHALKPKATVKSSGCGVCCIAMVVEGLTSKPFPPKEAAAFAIKGGARAAGGTDMAVLARAASQSFGLAYSATSKMEQAAEAISRGAWVIANVGGDRTGYTGLFSSAGHYVVVRGIVGGRFVVWDPGYYEGKFETAGRKGRVKVKVKGNDILVIPAFLDEDCRSRAPRYYIFEEESMTQEQFGKMMDAYLAGRAKRAASAWAVRGDVIGKAKAWGISDGSAPKALATREEVMAMIVRALDCIEK